MLLHLFSSKGRKPTSRKGLHTVIKVLIASFLFIVLALVLLAIFTNQINPFSQYISKSLADAFSGISKILAGY